MHRAAIRLKVRQSERELYSRGKNESPSDNDDAEDRKHGLHEKKNTGPKGAKKVETRRHRLCLIAHGATI